MPGGYHLTRPLRTAVFLLYRSEGEADISYTYTLVQYRQDHQAVNRLVYCGSLVHRPNRSRLAVIRQKCSFGGGV